MAQIIHFRLDGKLWGYAQTTRATIHSKDPKVRARIEKRVAFKEYILLTAMEAGFTGKCEALKSCPPYLSVHVYWNKNPRIDWKNIYGLIEDSLFSPDQFVKPGRKQGLTWDCGEEYAEVWIEI